jgi:23S rRNA (adenine2503-C2)-methyltransferase
MLAERLDITLGTVVRHQHATDATQKLLIDWTPAPVWVAPLPTSDFRLPTFQPNPGQQTECVLIPTEHRRTACISSQIGCPVGCRFCASGLGGLDGNLTAGQIVQQVWQLGTMLHDQGDAIGRVTNVVFMGMGEPLANFPNVSKALQLLTAEWGLNLSARKITISTVGVAPGIRKLAKLDIPVTLAISLHAPNDDIRRQIIPWAKFVTIDELCEAGQDYFKTTGREVTLEYILLRNVNDRPEHARELADVARKLRSNINLIRYNEVAGLPYQRPSTDDVRTFQDILQKRGINTHIRQSRGRDIAAACGQLRHEASKAS